MSSSLPGRGARPRLVRLAAAGSVPLVLIAAGAGSCASGGAEGAATDDAPTARSGSSPAVPLEGATLQGLGPKYGEYGLWVRVEGDSVRASWITMEAGPAWFEAEAPGLPGPVEARTISSGVAHAAAFEIPPTDEVVLRYGAADDPGDRHETRIRLTGLRRPPVEVPAPDSIYVIGDTHGEFQNVLQVLGNAGLVDGEGRWTGGRSHLVVLGDMMSRGDHATAVLWFFYRLEREAAEAGGRVHVVLGNHELMVMLDDLRYVQPKERRIAELHGTEYREMFHPRRSVLGYWLTTKPALITIDGVLLAHGGLAPRYAAFDAPALDDSVATWLSEETFRRWPDDEFWEDPNLSLPVDSVGWARRLNFLFEPESPVWYREYAENPESGGTLEEVLARHDARLHVIGHTPVPEIHERHGGRLILTNTFPFAVEVLLLVRDPEAPGGYARSRIGFQGPPMPLVTLF